MITVTTNDDDDDDDDDANVKPGFHSNAIACVAYVACVA